MSPDDDGTRTVWPDDRWHLTPEQRHADDRMTAALAGTLRTSGGARHAAPV